MRSRKEKPIFRSLTIAAGGDLQGGDQWTDKNIARWVGLREGKFTRTWSDDVTHVMCSREVLRAAMKTPVGGKKLGCGRGERGVVEMGKFCF